MGIIKFYYRKDDLIMSQLLFLKKVAIATKDLQLLNELERVFIYKEKKGCKIVTEILDNSILIYDTTNIEFLLKIHISLSVDYLNKEA